MKTKVEFGRRGRVAPVKTVPKVTAMQRLQKTMGRWWPGHASRDNRGAKPGRPPRELPQRRI